jgi:hypothetical protein
MNTETSSAILNDRYPRPRTSDMLHMEFHSSDMTPDCSWTTGDDVNLCHIRIIDRGGFGEVHEVHTS